MTQSRLFALVYLRSGEPNATIAATIVKTHSQQVRAEI